MSNVSTTPEPSKGKQGIIYAFIGAVVAALVPPVREICSYFLALSIPLSMSVAMLMLLSVVLFVIGLFFIIKRFWQEWRKMRMFTIGITVLGGAGLIGTLAAAFIFGSVSLRRFELTTKNIYDSMELPVPIRWNLESVSIKVSGGYVPGSSMQLQNKESHERLTIIGLDRDKEIEQDLFYLLAQGEYAIEGLFQAGDTLFLRIENMPEIKGRVILEFTGSKYKR
jgi:hypothetical protein